jgi:hypothetical protein
MIEGFLKHNIRLWIFGSIYNHQSSIFNSIEGSRGAISFRNILAPEYDTVDNVIVWGIIEKDL